MPDDHSLGLSSTRPRFKGPELWRKDDRRDVSKLKHIAHILSDGSSTDENGAIVRFKQGPNPCKLVMRKFEENLC